MKSMSAKRRCFGVMQKFTEALNMNNGRYMKLARTDPKILDSPFFVNTLSASQPTRHLSKLRNGIQVLTETAPLPGVVNFGVILNAGTRNEDKNSSGALHSIKTTYYKSLLNTNETINYGMIQMTGGKYEMNYDRERAWFKAHCLAHDVVDVFGMMSDCVLEPRSFIGANAAIEKLQHSHKLQSQANTYFRVTDRLLSSIYGDKGLGMPVLGDEKNIVNLNAYTLQKFQIQNMSPSKMTIVGVGVENHGEFVELVDNFYGKLKDNSRGEELEPAQTSVFKECDVRARVQGSTKSDIFIVFENVDWKNDDLVKSHVAREFFGSADVTNPQCSETNQGLFSKIYKKQKFVHSIESFNMHFTDAGIFGFRLQVNNDSINSSLEALVDTLKNSDSINEAELHGAKTKLKRKIIESMSRDFERLEEYLKHQSIFGEVRTEMLLRQIDELTISDFKSWLSQLFTNKMGFMLEGSELGNVFPHAKVKELFK